MHSFFTPLFDCALLLNYNNIMWYQVWIDLILHAEKTEKLCILIDILMKFVFVLFYGIWSLWVPFSFLYDYYFEWMTLLFIGFFNTFLEKSKNIFIVIKTGLLFIIFDISRQGENHVVLSEELGEFCTIF